MMYYDVEVWVRIDEYWKRQFRFAVKGSELKEITKTNWNISCVDVKTVSFIGYLKRQLLTGINSKKDFFTP